MTYTLILSRTTTVVVDKETIDQMLRQGLIVPVKDFERHGIVIERRFRLLDDVDAWL